MKIFSDNTDTYSAATTDAINYQVVTASTGTSKAGQQRIIFIQLTARYLGYEELVGA